MTGGVGEEPPAEEAGMPEAEPDRATGARRSTPSSDTLWQRRLLPVMVSFLVVFAGFFFLASLAQVIYLHATLAEGPIVETGTQSSAITPAVEQDLDFLTYQTAIGLEREALARRHHHASVSLMSKIWMHYLGFVTGMILALVGAAFILGKLREPVSEISTGASPATLSLKTSSPGLALAALGVLLMSLTIIARHETSVTDAPVYVRPANSGGNDATNLAAEGETAPTILAPQLGQHPAERSEPDANRED